MRLWYQLPSRYHLLMVASPAAVPQFLVALVSRLTAHALPQYDNYNAISYISGADAQATILEEENNPNGGLGNYNYRWGRPTRLTTNGRYC